MRAWNLRLIVAGMLVPALNAPACGQDDRFADVRIETTKLADGVSMLQGAGGNLGVLVGDDGVFLIDTQFAPLSEKIRSAIAKLSDRPIRFVLNTHRHYDHTGGNENFAKAGAILVAHDRVRHRMASAEPPPPAVALPMVTFTDTVTFHLNGEEIHVFHPGASHSDGDAIVHFRKANVIHMGDLFFNGIYPYIDVANGGSVDGLIAAIERILELADAETRIIPGHGPLANRAGLAAYLGMLVDVRDRVAAIVAAGRSLEQAIRAKPTAAYDAEWETEFMPPEEFVKIVYRSLSGD